LLNPYTHAPFVDEDEDEPSSAAKEKEEENDKPADGTTQNRGNSDVQTSASAESAAVAERGPTVRSGQQTARPFHLKKKQTTLPADASTSTLPYSSTNHI
jgi:hypothetical protein